MNQDSKKTKTLTQLELLKISGLNIKSESEAEEVIHSLEKFSILLFELHKKSGASDDVEHEKKVNQPAENKKGKK